MRCAVRAVRALWACAQRQPETDLDSTPVSLTIPPVTVKAWLNGDRPDLEALAALFADGPVRVLRETADGAYYLTAPEIDNPPETNRHDISAQTLVTRINGLARASDANFRPVRLTGTYTMPDGHNQHYTAATLGVRATLGVAAIAIGPEGQPQPQPPSPSIGYLAAAESNPTVGEVLKIMGRDGQLDWVELYKVYELVRRAVRPDTLVSRGWTTSAEESAFTASANRPDVSGETARHAVPQGATAPRHTMTIDQARSYISDLVTNWLANP